MKNIIRLSETELRNIIDESIKSVLNKGENFIINESKSYKFRIDENIIIPKEKADITQR